MNWYVAAWVVIALFRVSPAVADDLQAQVNQQAQARQLVRELASASPEQIARIEVQLAQLGESAGVALRVAELSGSFDVRDRAQKISRRVRWRIAATPALIDKYPTVIDVMSAGDAHMRADMVDQIAKAKSADAVCFFGECMADGQPYVHQRAIDALVEIAQSQKSRRAAVLAMLENHLDGTDENRVALLVNGLSKLQEFDVDRMGRLLEFDSSELRLMVVLALGDSHQPRASKYLMPMLGDTHWRVRASAAEAIGKLRDKSAGPALGKLLDDPDPFVAKIALQALMDIDQLPAGEQLQQLADRQTELIPLIVDLLVRSRHIEDLLALYQSRPHERGTIVDAMTQARRGLTEGSAEAWMKLLQSIDQHAQSSEQDLGFFKLLNLRPAADAKPFIGKRLESPDAYVRRAAAIQVIRVMATGGGASVETPAHKVPTSAGTSGEKPRPDAQAGESLPSLASQWHQSLARRVAGDFDIAPAVAYYLTGEPTDNLAMLDRATADERFNALAVEMEESLFIALFGKLPWPQGENAIDGLLGHRGCYVWMLGAMEYARPEARARMLSSGVLVANIEQAEGDEQKEALVEQLSDDRGTALGLAISSDASVKVARALLDSKSGLARALGVHLIGSWKQADYLPDMQRGLKDADAQVRLMAVRYLDQWRLPQEQTEALFGPMLWDSDAAVSQAAAEAMWVPGVAEVVTWTGDDSYFQYDQVQVWLDILHRSSGSVTPPIQPLSRKPAFMPKLVQWIDAPAHREHADQKQYQAFAILAAQYGELTGMEHLWAWWKSQPPGTTPPDSLTLAPTFSDAPKYLEATRVRVEMLNNQYELQQVLQVLRAAHGGEARELRRAINRRIRNLSD